MTNLYTDYTKKFQRETERNRENEREKQREKKKEQRERGKERNREREREKERETERERERKGRERKRERSTITDYLLHNSANIRAETSILYSNLTVKKMSFSSSYYANNPEQHHPGRIHVAKWVNHIDRQCDLDRWQGRRNKRSQEVRSQCIFIVSNLKTYEELSVICPSGYQFCHQEL